MPQKSTVSPQYLKESRISVTVIEMKSPAHYVVKESPSLNISSEAKKFVEAEAMMQKYYHSIEPTFFQLPLKNSIVVVLKDNKFYRAQVRSIMTVSEGHLIKCYLLDYGIQCTIPRNCLFQIQQDFLQHPFQAVEFKLLNVSPITLVLNSEDLGINYGAVDDWDTSAIAFVEKLREGMIDAHIRVRGVGSDFLAGSLYMSFVDNEVKCINDELTLKKYAQYNTDCWNNVMKMRDVLSKLSEQPSGVLQNSATPTCSSRSSRTSPSSLITEATMLRSPEEHISDVPQSNSMSSSSPNTSSRTSPNSLMAKAALLKLSKQHKNTLQRNTTPTSSPNSLLELSMNLPTPSKLPGQDANTLHGCSSPRSSQITPISSRIIETTSPELAGWQKELQVTTPSSSQSSSSQVSPNSFVEENKPDEPEKRLQNLLKLRINKDKKLKIIENVEETESAIPEKMKMETENVSQSKEISCDDTNTGKKQLQRLLKYRNLVSSRLSLSPKETSDSPPSLKNAVNYTSCATSPPSTFSDTCSESSPPNSNRPCKMQTPVKNAHQSTSNDKISPQNVIRKFTSPKLKIALEGPINRSSNENIKQNSPSEAPDKISKDQLNTEEVSPLKSPPKKSFEEMKKFLYRKRNSSVSSYQTQELDTKINKDNKNVSESENEANVSQNVSIEDEKESNEMLSPEYQPKDLSESLNLDDLDIDDEDDILHCALKPKIEDDSPASEDTPINSCSDNSDIKIDFSDKSLWQKQRVPALIIGSGGSQPALSTSATFFPDQLKKVLEDVNFCGPSSIQSVVWPAVQRGRSVAIIAPPHSGKTVAYLLPIVSNFLSETAYAKLPKGEGPVAIIICSNWKKVQAVYDLFRVFFKGSKNVKILTFFVDGRSKRNKIRAVSNGCDILISVSSCLLDFFKEYVICTGRCLYFILDDGSNLLTYHMDEIKQIMAYFVLEAKRTKLKNREFVICAERWTRSVASFVARFMSSPLLLFTSFLEAAIYSKVPMYPHVCEESDKNMKLLNILESTRRTIICTASSKTASDIHAFLKCEEVRSYLVNEEQEHYISEGIVQDWKSVKSTAEPHCLIVTDAALSNINISNANYLIHYDVPEVSRLQFGNRFSFIAEHFPNLAQNPDCICHIFISGECISQAPSLVKIIRQCGIEVPKELINLAAQEVIESTDLPLCHNFKAFGYCKISSCGFRHQVDPVADKPTALTREGDVQALVTHVFDASHFYVRILKHLPPNAVEPICMSGSYAKIGFQLKNFYSSESNKLNVECPAVGKCYILQEENKLFFRVKVLNITPATQFQLQKVDLLFLDEGWVRMYEYCQLLKYEESLQLPPPHAVEVYLCGVDTPDSSLEWNPHANRFMTNLIKDRDIHGKIALCLGETLWLHPIVLREKLVFLNDYVNILALDKSLIKGRYALNNKIHLSSLSPSCADVFLPIKYEMNKSEIQDITLDQPAVTYAFLDINEFEDVYVSSVISPQQVYIQRAKFVECLDDLLDKISACVNDNTLKKCKSFLKGMHCIAPFSEDNRFYRAVLVDIMSYGDCVQVFFVDFGDSEKVPKDSIYILPPELLLLPFQAIECELNGICAPHGGWSDKTVDTLRALTRDDAGDMKILELMSYSKSCGYEGGYHYVVDLWSSEKTISEQLLEAGLVSPAEKAVPVVSEREVWEDEAIFEDVPEGYVVSSEEDLAPEDKDIHALFCGKLAKLLMEGSTADSITSIPEVSTEEENSRDRNTNPGKQNRSNLIEEEIEIMPTVARSPLQALQKLMNFRKGQKEQKSAKPFITWWDTVEQLHVLINLRDIQLYELNLSDSGFKFKTSLRDVDYYTEINFYSEIYAENAKTRSMTEGLNIDLNKRKAERWPRFSKEVTKLYHVMYDVSHLDDSDTDEKAEESTAPVPENQIDKNEVVSYLSEDENSLHSEEDENYIQSWMKLSEYKDPFSPLE